MQPDDVTTIQPGTTLGRFQLSCALGRRTFVAHDPELRREVVVKILDEQEPEGIARLEHPGVAIVHDVGTHAGRGYVAMERLSGPTLGEWLASGVGRDAIGTALLQLAGALAAGHAQGLAVRSLADVRLAGDGPKITTLRAGDEAAQRANVDELLAAAARAPLDLALLPTATLADLIDALRRRAARRPRRAGRIVAAILVASAIAGGAALAIRRQSLCRGFGPRLVAIYGEPARQRIRDGLRRAAAATATEPILLALDAYAARWIRDGEAACRATRIAGTQPEQELDLRVACLERRRAELGQLVEILARADATIAQNGRQLARSLGELDECADLRRLTGVLPEPIDPGRRAAIRNAREQLAAVRVVHNAGKYPEGLQRLAPLLDKVKQLDYAPLTAETQFVAAMLQRGTGAHDQAIAQLQEAALSAELGRDDPLRADAWTELIQSLIQSGQYDAAARHVPQVEAAIQRLGSPPVPRARLLRCRGQLEVASENFAAALPLWKEALGLLAARPELDPTFVALLNDDLAALLPTVGAPIEEALRHGEAGLLAWRALYGEDHPFVAASLDGLGGTYALLGRHREATRALEAALAMREALLGPAHAQVAESLLHLSQHEADLGHYRRALGLLERAERLFGGAPEALLERRAIRRERAEIWVAQERDAQAAPLLRQLLDETGDDALSELERPWTMLAEAAIAERRQGAAAADRLFARADVLFLKHLVDAPVDLESLRLARAQQLVEHGRGAGAEVLIRPAWLRTQALADRASGRRFAPALLMGEAKLAARQLDDAASALAEARRIDDLGDQLNAHDRAQLRLAEVELGLALRRERAELVKLLDEADRLLTTEEAPLTRLHRRATRLRAALR